MSRSKNVSFENIDMYRQISYNIAYYRKRKGLTQDVLAEKVDISRTHMGNIEAANIIKPFSLEVLFNIARALDIEPYKLLMIRD